MRKKLSSLVSSLEVNGWQVNLFPEPREIPVPILNRYPWLPKNVTEFLAEVQEAISLDEKSWFNSIDDFAGDSKSAFRWNQWEHESLIAADDDDWKDEVKKFWDEHFPIINSVRNAYSYVAITRDSVISGCEPEFEETVFVASSFSDLIERIGSPEINCYF